MEIKSVFSRYGYKIKNPYTKFYKLVWCQCFEGSIINENPACVFPARFKYILLDDLEKNEKLIKAMIKYEDAFFYGCSIYPGATSVVELSNMDIARWKFEKLAKKFNVKLYDEKEVMIRHYLQPAENDGTTVKSKKYLQSTANDEAKMKAEDLLQPTEHDKSKDDYCF